MAVPRVLLSMACLLLLGSVPYAQFVTLEGRQFQLDGEPFYPVAMNFPVSYFRDSTITGTIPPDSIHLASDASHGRTNTFDCDGAPGCTERLLLDFQKARSMGFNTLRIVGSSTANYRHAPDLGAEERRYTITVSQHPFRLSANHVPNHDHGKRVVDLEEDLDGPYTARQLTLVQELLDVAEQADLKVILLVAGPTGRDSLAGRTLMYQAFDQRAVDDYGRYLAKLGDALEGHPALLAYDLFNEPHYNRMEFQQCTDPKETDGLPKWTKEDICTFTQQWYDTLHLHDTTHLVTLGGLGLSELEVWDMGALHLDFYSVHLYPEPDYLKRWDVKYATSRFTAELYWFSRVCPLPWIIGETGFGANDRADSVYLPQVGIDPEYHAWPYMHGTEAEQAAFADTTLKMVRAWGGAGWSWWMFQEWRWWHPYFQQPYQHAAEQFGAFYGMLHLGDANADWYDKPSVEVVQEYVPGPLPPATDLPPNYYNWSELSGDVSFSGTVLDQDESPIPDAMAWMVFQSKDAEGGEDMDTYETSHAVPVNEEGDFHFLTEETGAGYVEPALHNLIMVGVGTEALSLGMWTGTPLVSGITHHLQRHPFYTPQVVTDVELTSQLSDPDVAYTGGQELRVGDVIVQGTPDPGARNVEFTASREVHITGEFHAEAGSEVHVFLEPAFAACSDTSYRYAPAVGTDPAPAPVHRMAGAQRVELRFTDGEPDLRAYPNPFTDRITVEWDGRLPAEVELLDALGHSLGQWPLRNPRTTIHFEAITNGAYLLQVVGDIRRSAPLIKQHRP